MLTPAGEIVVMRARHGDVVPDEALTVDVGVLQSAANAVLYDGKWVRVWYLSTGTCLTTFHFPDAVKAMALPRTPPLWPASAGKWPPSALNPSSGGSVEQ